MVVGDGVRWLHITCLKPGFAISISTLRHLMPEYKCCILITDFVMEGIVFVYLHVD